MEPDPAAVRRYLAHVVDRVEAFGTVRAVYHDKRVGFPHVDIYVIDAVLAGKPRIVLLTVGCAFVDRGTQERVELAVVLPDTWPITEEKLERPELFWPFGWLRFIGHELPKLMYGPLPGDIWRMPLAATAPATRFSAVLGVPADWVHAELGDGLILPDGTAVSITALIPIRTDEREWALARGEDAEDGAALVELLDGRRVESIVIDDERPTFIAS